MFYYYCFSWYFSFCGALRFDSVWFSKVPCDLARSTWVEGDWVTLEVLSFKTLLPSVLMIGGIHQLYRLWSYLCLLDSLTFHKLIYIFFLLVPLLLWRKEYSRPWMPKGFWWWWWSIVVVPALYKYSVLGIHWAENGFLVCLLTDNKGYSWSTRCSDEVGRVCNTRWCWTNYRVWKLST